MTTQKTKALAVRGDPGTREREEGGPRPAGRLEVLRVAAMEIAVAVAMAMAVAVAVALALD